MGVSAGRWGVVGGRFAVPAPESVQAALQKILASQEFARSERAGQLLDFVVRRVLEGGRKDLKEYVLGVEVFDRGPDFDPRTDTIVRVEARRLRARLEQYYEGEGRGDPVLILLPKGHYAPEFRFRELPKTPASLVKQPKRFKAPTWALSAVAATVLAVAAGTIGWRIYSAARQAPMSAIAVLPFVNLSGEAETDYLGDALADELTTSLAQIEGLRVVARTSAFRFRGAGQDLGEVARRLNAGAVLEGGVRKAGGKLHVTAQLIGAADGYHIWAERYERDASQLASLQAEIVEGVAAALNKKLKAGWARPQPPPAAYELYMKARYFADRRQREDLLKAIGLYGEAIRLGPDYAPAYSGLADACADLVLFNDPPPAPDLLLKFRTATERALKLDETLAEAHVSRAWILLLFDGDWTGADREFRRALELNPNFAKARHLRAMELTAWRRFGEALAEARAAQTLDPASYMVANNVAVIHCAARRYDDAIREAQRTLALASDFLPANVALGMAYVGKRQYPQAIAELRKGLGLERAAPEVLGRLGYAYAVAGQTNRALETLAELERSQTQPAFAPAAMVYAGLGLKDKAFDSLDKAIGQHEPAMLFLDVDPMLEPLRADPRFASMRKRIGLPD